MSVEIKIIFVGNANVGKTSIATRYVNGTFSENIEPTVGAAYLSKEVEISGNHVTFNIWDTAGQEAYRYLVPMYYRNAQIAVVVFDLTNMSSFQAVGDWINDVRKNVVDDIVILICGNKCDMPEKNVDFDTIQDFSHNNDLIYVETSAANGTGINKLFEIALSEYLKKGTNSPTSTQKSLDVTKQSKTGKGGCC